MCALHKTWEYRSDVNYKDSLTPTRLYTALQDTLHHSVFMGAFFKFSEHFFDQDEFLSFTYM